MAEENDEVAKEEVAEEKTQPASQPQTSCFAKWVDGLTSSRVVVLFCMFALCFVALQYFFTAIAYVGVMITIMSVLKLLCLIGAGVAFSFKLIKTKSVALDGTLVLFLVTVFIGMLR